MMMMMRLIISLQPSHVASEVISHQNSQYITYQMFISITLVY